MIFAELAGREAGLAEPAPPAEVVGRLEAVEVAAAEHVLAVDVAVLAGPRREQAEPTPAAGVAQAAQAGLDVEPTGRPRPVPRLAVRADPVRAEQASLRVLGEFPDRAVLEPPPDDQRVGVKPQDEPGDTPQAATGSRWRS